MRLMEYGCKYESRAARYDLCKKIPPRKAFNYTDMNYRYVYHRPHRTPLEALLDAVHEWWDTHLYNHGFRGLIPRKKDFPTIPFFMMANAETWRLGCAVELCIDNDSPTLARYYAVVCRYGRPPRHWAKPLYEKRSTVSKCGPRPSKMPLQEKKLCDENNEVHDFI
ncbi:hypothetical protein OSTOST_18520 [Ostertagia ostertagi]